MASSPCLSDEDLAAPFTANDARLAHLEACDGCRAIWLHAHDDVGAAGAVAWSVGRYEVRGTLGAGGIGVVLLGWDPALGREVAIKFSSGRGETSLDEAKALAAIRHRNVVAVHDFGDVDGDVYITMERVAGSTFDTWWLGAGARERVRALGDVADGLAAIHAAGLVHCDVKPGNIVVTPAGDVVIVDLGLATPHGDRARLAGGTPGFFAPELEGGGAPTVASDEYAFWCVARQCLGSASLTARQRRRLDALIARGTSTQPAARFGSMHACGAALRELVAPRRALVVTATLAATAVLAAGAAVLLGGAPSGTAAASSSCTTELPEWSAASRAAVSRQLVARPEVRDRVDAFVAREREAAHGLLAQACRHEQDAAWLRTRSCVMTSWDWIDGMLRAIGQGRDVGASLEELPQGVPMARCAPGNVFASAPAVPRNATPGSQAVSAQMGALVGLPPAEHARQLEALRPRVDAVANPGLRAAWHFELADAHHRLGAREPALEHALAAMDVATRNGDDLVLARARLTVYLLRDAHDRSASTRDAETEAVIARAGSPGLLAHFHDAAGQRAIAMGDLVRAGSLLQRALDEHTAIELAPSSLHGSAEQNLGVVRQFSRDLEGAQAHFERAAAIFTARFGPAHDQTLLARLAVSHNLLYRGQVDPAARALDDLAKELAASARTKTALGARVALARCQAAQALQRDALERCRDAVSTSRTVHGDDSIELVPALLALAQLEMASSVRGAMPLLEEAIAIAERQADQPTDLPYARGLYALALKVVGRPSDGVILARQAIGDLDRLGQRDLAATLRTHYPAL